MSIQIVTNFNVPNCNGCHNIVFNGNRAVITVNEFYNIVRHWEQNLKIICGEICKHKNIPTPYRRLNFIKMLKDRQAEVIKK